MDQICCGKYFYLLIIHLFPQQYMAPSLAYFGDIHHDPFNNYRVYGTAFLILITLIVAVGVKFVQLFAPFSLSCVVISVLCVFIGGFQANKDTRDVW